MSARSGAVAFVLALGVVASPRSGLAVCYGPSLLTSDVPTYQTIPDRPHVFTQSTAYWAVFASMPFSETNDGDVELYSSTSSLTEPYCLGGYLVGSANGAGRTDFVIADFNTTPHGSYYPRVFCYSGDCGSSSGQWSGSVWRAGDLLTVDAAPITISFTTFNPVPPDRIIKVWDVYLWAGSTYEFIFNSTMGTDAKMLLFRNTSGGAYLAGRNAAQFEVTGCTSYTAPSSGWYGLVVVLDRWTSGSYSIGVSSSPSCAYCSTQLQEMTPVAIDDPGFGEAYHYAIPYSDWRAAALRAPAPGDWDLETGLGDTGDGLGCPNGVRASSRLGSGWADVVVANYGSTSIPNAFHSYRYSGTSGASLEWEGSTLVWVNGREIVRTLSGSDVVDCYRARLESGKSYTFEFSAMGASFSMLLFRNPGNPQYTEYHAGRNQAEFDVTSSATYVAPETGEFLVVVVKNDENIGTYKLRVGSCVEAAPLTAGVGLEKHLWDAFVWGSFAPSAGSWTTVGTRGHADWDLVLYGSGSDVWPDCFAPLLKSSGTTSPFDFVVGDFHANAPGTYVARAKQYTSGFTTDATLEWSGAAKPLYVNAPAVTDSIENVGSIVRMWESWLMAGVTYQLELSQPAGSTVRAYFFENPGGTYWAGKTSRVFETGGTYSFVPAKSGWHGIVVGDENWTKTIFTLRMTTTSTLAVGEGPPRHETALAGATPNPARADFAIRYSLARPGQVRIQLIDLGGRRVADLDEGVRDAGEWSLEVPRHRQDGTRLPAGVYFARMSVDGRVAATRKFSLMD